MFIITTHTGSRQLINETYITMVEVKISLSTDKPYFKISMTDRVVEAAYTFANYRSMCFALGLTTQADTNIFTGNLLSEDFPKD